MNYKKVYNSLTRKRNRSLEVKEIHHIKPKSLGGDDSTENLVELTPREHFIAHRLLVKMLVGEEKRKMTFALWRMANGGQIESSRVYESIRKDFSKALSEHRTGKRFTKHSEEAKRKARLRSMGEKNNMYGKSHTDETKKKISESKKGTGLGKENPFYGKTHSKETIDRIAKKSSEKQKGIPKPKVKCPLCKKLFGKNVIRVHTEKCAKTAYAEKM